ncbi:MAG: pyruvate dehydrogenase (acetyl-transferring) E1 component subunit alpha [Nitriliruptoraceae bacterium]
MSRQVSNPDELLPGDLVRVIEPDGTVRQHDDFPFDIEDETLVDLYRQMLLTRAVDREAINLQRQGQLAVYPSCLGQEAAQVGAARALRNDDWVFPSYRELGFALARGIDPIRMMHVYRGTWLGDHDPHEHSFGHITIPIATQVLHATGFAMGTKLDGKDTVTVACCGDGATSEGDTHEAMTFAGVFEAPVVFFVQNNQYAISVPLERQTAAPTLAHKAIGYGMPGVRCDGNDVLATYAVMQSVVNRAREGGGPAMVEAVTYRREAHTTSDDPTRYRSDTEVEEAARHDPVDRLRLVLDQRDLRDDTVEREIADECAAATSKVRAAIYDADHDDPMEMFDHVMAGDTAFLDDQRAQLRAELAADAAGS